MDSTIPSYSGGGTKPTECSWHRADGIVLRLRLSQWSATLTELISHFSCSYSTIASALDVVYLVFH